MTEPTTARYYGKYRGTVVANVDPNGIGRVQAQVPDVYGSTPSTWAMPSFPVAGPQTGQYAVPPIGAGVWVEFEQGDKDYPIWSGCWYGSRAEVPVPATPQPQTMVLQTQGQQTVVLSDQPGVGITLKTASGAMLVINDSGIVITNGQGASISLTGATVTVNQGALVIT